MAMSRLGVSVLRVGRQSTVRAAVISVLLSATWAVPASLALFSSSSAWAQASTGLKDVGPYYVVVSADKATARCKDSASYYSVGELKKDQVLLVDAESDAWIRASYPAELTAFVRVEDVSVEGTNVRLTQPSRLRAANVVAGWAGSWQPLLNVAASAGTVLQKKDDIRETADGPIVGYRVAAPAQARVFVSAKSVRKATEAEERTFRAKFGLAPLPTKPADAPATKPAPAVSEQPLATKPATPAVDLTTPLVEAKTPVADPKSLDPVVPPGSPAAVPTPEASPTTLNQGQPNDPSQIQPDKVQPDAVQPEQVQPTFADATPTTEPVVNTEAQEAATRLRRQAVLAESLESKLRAVVAQPPLESEVDELIAEYENAVVNETSDRRRQALSGRLEYLRLRREFRDSVRRQEAARADLNSRNQEVQNALAQVAESRIYTVVGQLQPSTVYDGKVLPLMYRVVSIGTSAPRTLGYLTKSNEWDLDRMLGLVVGVIGDAQLDRSLKLNVISPIRVEVLTAGGPGESYRIQEGTRRATPTPAPSGEPAATPETDSDPSK